MHEVCNGTILRKEVAQKPELFPYQWKMHVVIVEKRNKLGIYFLLTYDHNLLVIKVPCVMAGMHHYNYSIVHLLS